MAANIFGPFPAHELNTITAGLSSITAKPDEKMTAHVDNGMVYFTILRVV